MDKRLHEDREAIIEGVSYALAASEQEMPDRFTWSWVCGSCKCSAATVGVADSITDALIEAFGGAKEHHAERHSMQPNREDAAAG